MKNLGRRGVLGRLCARIAVARRRPGRLSRQADPHGHRLRRRRTDRHRRPACWRQGVSEILGQQVVVENKPGATGNIGTAMVADAKPDGYTILFSASTMAMAPALYGKQVGYDPVNGFEGIAYVASVPLIVVVPADGAKSIGELADMLRKEKGKYSYPSSGNGGMIHLAGYLFAEKVGGEALHVPYRGSAPGMVDLIAGRHAFQMDTLGTSKGFIEGGKLRVLAVCRRQAPAAAARRADRAGGAGLPVLDQHLVRGLRAQGHAAADHRQAQRRLQQGAEGARGEEVGRRPRHRADPGVDAGLGQEVL